MTEYSDNIQKLKELRNPALQAESLTGYLRGILAGLRERGVPVTATVHTFEEAGLASAGEGVLYADASLEMEIRCTLGPEFTMDVHVQATTEKNEHLARMGNAVAPIVVGLAGLRAIPKGD